MPKIFESIAAFFKRIFYKINNNNSKDKYAYMRLYNPKNSPDEEEIIF